MEFKQYKIKVTGFKKNITFWKKMYYFTTITEETKLNKNM